MKQALALICCIALSGIASAQIYRHVDENGNVTFSDRPPADAQNAERVEIQTPNTAPPPTSNAYPAPVPTPEEEAAAAGNYTLAITSPENETIIPRGPGNVSVSASVSPPLSGNHKLQLLLNGTPREEPQTATTWALTNVFRGEQNISVAVVDENGNRISESSSVKIFVFRPSTNDRNRNTAARPPRPTPRGN